MFHCGGESTPLNISLTADGYGLSEVTLCQTVRLPPHAAVPALVLVGRPEGLMHIEQAVDLPEEPVYVSRIPAPVDQDHTRNNRHNPLMV